ncbi:MAG: DUF1080 domain-containing protein [Pirellulaceae bacterium]|nr:DUF1080 domain-containing protein [Pirellulaceae bacterium]
MLIRSLCLLVVFQFAFVASYAQEPIQLPPASPELVSIFNGEDLTAWDGDPRFWSVRDGVIRGETTEENRSPGNTFLVWEGGKTTDFELRLSFRLTASNNSGIQYRSQRLPADIAKHAWVVKGYQFEIRNEVDFPNVSGFVYDEGGKRGRMCLTGEIARWDSDAGKQVTGQLIDQESFKALFQLDDWNDAVIIARGNRMQHFLNNRLVVDFTDNDPNLALHDGVLALQLHGGAPMWVEFRDIRIKSLNDDSK